jgi:hypothetical protein
LFPDSAYALSLIWMELESKRAGRWRGPALRIADVDSAMASDGLADTAAEGAVDAPRNAAAAAELSLLHQGFAGGGADDRVAVGRRSYRGRRRGKAESGSRQHCNHDRTHLYFSLSFPS